MNIRTDERGIEGLPLRILVMSTVLAVLLPSLFMSLQNFDENQMENKVILEIERIFNVGEMIEKNGVGNSIVIDVDLSSGMFSGLEYVVFCSDYDGKFSYAKYKLRGEGEKTYLPDADVFFSYEGECLELGPGKYELRVWSEEEGGVRMRITA